MPPQTEPLTVGELYSSLIASSLILPFLVIIPLFYLSRELLKTSPLRELPRGKLLSYRLFGISFILWGVGYLGESLVATYILLTKSLNATVSEFEFIYRLSIGLSVGLFSVGLALIYLSLSVSDRDELKLSVSDIFFLGLGILGLIISLLPTSRWGYELPAPPRYGEITYLDTRTLALTLGFLLATVLFFRVISRVRRRLKEIREKTILTVGKFIILSYLLLVIYSILLLVGWGGYRWHPDAPYVPIGFALGIGYVILGVAALLLYCVTLLPSWFMRFIERFK